MKEKCCGILMEMKTITNGICLFKPISIIDGVVEEGEYGATFKDELGYEYLLFNDGEMISTDEEEAVGYIISQKSLIEDYNSDLNAAKASYFNKVQDNIHFGFYIIDEDKIGVVPFNLRKIYEKINSTKFDSDSPIVKINLQDSEMQPDPEFLGLEQLDDDDSEIIEADIDEQDMIFFTKEKFKELLKINDYDSLKAALESLNEQIDNIDSKDVKSNYDGDYIRSLFYKSYNALLNIDDLNELRDILEQIEEMYIELSLELDNNDNVNEAANDYIYNLVDRYSDIRKLNNLKLIRNALEKLKSSEQQYFETLAQKFDKENEAVKEDIKKEDKLTKTIDVKDMKKFFDQKIIGQEEAKKDVISSIVMNKLSNDRTNKNACLLVGPTGSGKTLIAETVGEYLDLPVEIIDTTQLTIPGYVGSNIEDFLARLIVKAGSLKKAEEGIVVFDEIDKKGSEKNEDVSGKGVLNTLLPFLQGTTYDVKSGKSTVNFDTSNLTIFATGAFTDVANKNDSGLYKSNNMGFNLSKNENKQDIEYRKLEIDDFVKYGNMPIELMGRFSTITQLSGHTKESLKKILTDSNISTLISERDKLSKLGISLDWTDGYIDAVAEYALKLKTGARSLKQTVEKSIKEARWEVISNLELYKGIILIAETVLDNQKCELIDINGNTIKLEDILNNEKVKIKVK